MTLNPASQRDVSGSKEAQSDADNCTKILQVMEKLAHIKDVHALLAEVLLQARRLTRADAGSIYLIENNVLNFSYIHNDTLFGASGVNRYLYASHTLAVDNHSLAGYVALSGKPLLIDDAYHLPPGMPFAFNDSFDRQSGYRTQSILAVPLVTSNNKTVGVMQIINPLNDDRQPSAFTPGDLLLLKHFADNAAAAIGTRHDDPGDHHENDQDVRTAGPQGNGGACQPGRRLRGGGLPSVVPQAGYCRRRDQAEQRPAENCRHAHTGKVAISDRILKKPDKLNSEEFRTMQYHTIHGARLFRNQESDLDVLSAEIALTIMRSGMVQDIRAKSRIFTRTSPGWGRGNRGRKSPITARIVALADIYDALVSRRVDKDAWSETTTLNYRL